MSIGEEIQKLAGKKNKSSDWYTNELMNRLMSLQTSNIHDLDTGGLSIGNLYFFQYSAQFSNKLDFWDRHPLVYVYDIQKGYFIGCNLHYINKSYRDDVAKSLINKRETINVPRSSIHRYLFSGVVSSFLKVPKKDWISVASLPTEKFVDDKGQNYPKHKVWSKT